MTGEHTDYVEFERPDGKKVRVVFEIYRNEILFYHYEYKHDKNSDWKSMTKGEGSSFQYTIKDDNGNEMSDSVLFPNVAEMKIAHETMGNRYVDFSI